MAAYGEGGVQSAARRWERDNAGDEGNTGSGKAVGRRAAARFVMAGTPEARLLRSLQSLDQDIKGYEDRVTIATTAIDTTMTEGDRLESERYKVEAELAQLGDGFSTESIAALRDRADDLEKRLTGQRDINMDLLHEICQLEDAHAEAAQRVFDINAQVDGVHADIEECANQIAQAKERTTLTNMEIQERMADRHRRLADVDAQIESLKRQTHESTGKRAALADLRSKNNKLQTIVDMVKDSLVNPPSKHEGDAKENFAASTPETVDSRHAPHKVFAKVGPEVRPRKHKVHFNEKSAI
eukprot:m.244233 g.244233  ORF g.244233 m.244233 type:complete len:298 (+) comp26370_c1_seq2:68-961(+)